MKQIGSENIVEGISENIEKNLHNLKLVILVDSVIYVAALVTSLLFHRLYSLLGDIFGLCCVVLGIFCVYTSQHKLVQAFCYMQFVGASIIFFILCNAFVEMCWYDLNCEDFHALNPGKDCIPRYIVALPCYTAPIFFVFYLLGAIYSRRLYDLLYISSLQDSDGNLADIDYMQMMANTRTN